MPIYEYYCPANNVIYCFYARTVSLASRVPRCPANPQFPMERLLSMFSVMGRAKERLPEHAGAFSARDTATDAAMAGLEREFAGIDMDDPDPRLLAKMMKSVLSVTGEQVPERINEMIRRMEAGEDAERLANEYGDAMEEFESNQDADAGREDTKMHLLSSRRAEPARDPHMYEMIDFLD